MLSKLFSGRKVIPDGNWEPHMKIKSSQNVSIWINEPFFSYFKISLKDNCLTKI